MEKNPTYDEIIELYECMKEFKQLEQNGLIDLESMTLAQDQILKRIELISSNLDKNILSSATEVNKQLDYSLSSGIIAAGFGIGFAANAIQQLNGRSAFLISLSIYFLIFSIIFAFIHSINTIGFHRQDFNFWNKRKEDFNAKKYKNLENFNNETIILRKKFLKLRSNEYFFYFQFSALFFGFFILLLAIIDSKNLFSVDLWG